LNVIVFDEQPFESLSPGVSRSRLEPGGKDGPAGIVRESDQPGGATWSASYSLGRPDDEWRLVIPDIRMAANQIWPLHWHDCWTAVVALDGTIMIGDWWMERGDVLIAAPSVEYGLLLNGPKGSQVLEIFARDTLSPGGYAPEFHDHPTLVYLKGLETTDFLPRPPGSEGNAGNQIVPVDGTPGLAKGRLTGDGYWDLGDPGNPERGVLLDRKLPAGTVLAPTSYGDWRATLVFDGSMTVGEAEFGANDMLIIEPGGKVPEIAVGAGGVHLLETARTTASCDPTELERGAVPA
jgi:hypothetical protein